MSSHIERCSIAGARVLILLTVSCASSNDEEPAATGAEETRTMGCDSLDFATCDAELAGAWVWEEACLSGGALLFAPLSPDGCRIERVIPNAEVEGGAIFDTDGRFEYSARISGLVELELARECSVDQSCGALDDSVEGLSCVGHPGLGCSCSLVVETENRETGAYRLVGGEMIRQVDGREGFDTVPICTRQDVTWMSFPVEDLPGLRAIIRLRRAD